MSKDTYEPCADLLGGAIEGEMTDARRVERLRKALENMLRVLEPDSFYAIKIADVLEETK